MEEGQVSPSMAMALISQGKAQEIAVDSKRLITMVMQALGAKEMPVFSETICQGQGLKVSIKLDVSCAKYFVGQTIETAVVDGDPSHSKVLAERSAVLKAIKHLKKKNLIKIVDFSDRVVNDIEDSSAFGDVNSAMYCLDKVIAQWEVTLEKCSSLAAKLEGMDAGCDVDHEYEKWDLYGSLNCFMAVMVETMTTKVTDARAKATALEFMRKKYQHRADERHQEELRKGYMQVVEITPKVLLDYVLEYLGGGPTKYTNSPTTDWFMKGVVQFYIPPVPGIKCSGNIEIKGKDTTSEKAEQEAAFKALMFIETTYNIRILDINHGERQTAEKEHKLIVNILGEIVTVGAGVQKTWGKMLKYLGKENKTYKIDASARFPGEGTAKKIEAYRFCSEVIEELHADIAKRYEGCAEMFEKLNKLHYKLDELKAEVNME